MDSNAPSVHPQQALAVYAESLVAGARVAVFGDASLGLGSRLAELGARSVQIWDPDAARAQAESEQAPRGVTVQGYSELETLETNLRAVDLALVADLGLFPDPAALVRRVRRAVGAEGVAMIAAKSAEVAQADGQRAFDYYDLFDLVAPEFESVRMVAQLPFHGVALVELGEDDESPAVNVDTQLAESGRVPDAFVVVASQREARVEPYSIVQLPSPVRVEADAVDREAIARAELRAELLTSQLDDLRARMVESARTVDAVAELEETVRARSTRVAELEKALAARGRELAELSNEVEEVRAAAEAGRIAAAQVAEIALRADRSEKRATLLEAELSGLAQELAKGGDAHATELARAEEGLRERAQAVRLLEAEVSRREQMVRDLVGTLDELHAEGVLALPVVVLDRVLDREEQGDFGGERGAAPLHVAPAGPSADVTARAIALSEENAQLRQQLDALALDLARREGEGQAAAWQVTELERRLVQAETESKGVAAPEANPPHLSRQLAQALDELDALRTALAQEHEARTRAESGEELTTARAEIARQATLLEQLAANAGGVGGAPGFDRVSEGRHVPPGSNEDSR